MTMRGGLFVRCAEAGFFVVACSMLKIYNTMCILILKFQFQSNKRLQRYILFVFVCTLMRVCSVVLIWIFQSEKKF